MTTGTFMEDFYAAVVARHERAAMQMRSTLGVSANERLALMHLLTDGALTASELSSRLQLTTAAVTTLIDRLERDDLVRRVKDTQDRRRNLLHVSKRVVRESLATDAHVPTLCAEVLEQMPPGEREAVANFLRAATAKLEREADAAPNRSNGTSPDSVA